MGFKEIFMVEKSYDVSGLGWRNEPDGLVDLVEKELFSSIPILPETHPDYNKTLVAIDKRLVRFNLSKLLVDRLEDVPLTPRFVDVAVYLYRLLDSKKEFADRIASFTCMVCAPRENYYVYVINEAEEIAPIIAKLDISFL